MTALPVGGPELPQRRNLVTEIPGPVSRTLMERRNSTVARGVSTTLPVFVTAAGGGVMLDADGNSLIDFGSGIAVASVGNAADAVVSRVQEQVAQFTHTCFMVTPYEGYVEVCEELARRTPGTHEKRSALFNSGAEAVETIKTLIHTQVGEDNVAAVILEPIQGEGGFIVPPEGFIAALAEFCQEHGIVFIADEIQSGFCRTGDWFACEHEGVVPDLITTAK